ncbi:MAG: four helix bundle protein [Calditrichaceae bacterium]|nr:four helix bundle protein [Calditrichaceae bacterium]HES59648.1 four helix bundle protein [Caldithrix sp.]
MKLEELQVYQISMEIGNKVWEIVKAWEHFEKRTLGDQIIRSADSIAANISEGYGRYHFKENKQFTYYARGSLYETITWLSKAKNRNLITTNVFEELKSQLETLNIKLNAYIKSIGKKTTNDK